MRFFFDQRVAPEGTTFNATPSYFELITSSTEPPGTSYVYVTAGPIPYSVTVKASWGHDLDAWLPYITDPKRSADWIHAFGSTYPTIGRLWRAAASNELGRSALIRDIDPDDMSIKWVAECSVGNVSVPDEVTVEAAQALLSSPRLVDTYRIVLNDSFDAARELATRTPSASLKTLMFGKELLRSQLEAIDTFNKWAPRLSAIFGG